MRLEEEVRGRRGDCLRVAFSNLNRISCRVQSNYPQGTFSSTYFPFREDENVEQTD